MLAKRNFGIGKSVVYPYPTSWNIDTKKIREEVTLPPKEGAFVHGLYMEGARWDVDTNSIADSRLKELHPEMPVMYLRAVTQVREEKGRRE